MAKEPHEMSSSDEESVSLAALPKDSPASASPDPTAPVAPPSPPGPSAPTSKGSYRTPDDLRASNVASHMNQYIADFYKGVLGDPIADGVALANLYKPESRTADRLHVIDEEVLSESAKAIADAIQVTEYDTSTHPNTPKHGGYLVDSRARIINIMGEDSKRQRELEKESNIKPILLQDAEGVVKLWDRCRENYHASDLRLQQAQQKDLDELEQAFYEEDPFNPGERRLKTIEDAHGDPMPAADVKKFYDNKREKLLELHENQRRMLVDLYNQRKKNIEDRYQQAQGEFIATEIHNKYYPNKVEHGSASPYAEDFIHHWSKQFFGEVEFKDAKGNAVKAQIWGEGETQQLPDGSYIRRSEVAYANTSLLGRWGLTKGQPLFASVTVNVKPNGETTLSVKYTGKMTDAEKIEALKGALAMAALAGMNYFNVSNLPYKKKDMVELVMHVLKHNPDAKIDGFEITPEMRVKAREQQGKLYAGYKGEPLTKLDPASGDEVSALDPIDLPPPADPSLLTGPTSGVRHLHPPGTASRPPSGPAPSRSFPPPLGKNPYDLDDDYHFGGGSASSSSEYDSDTASSDNDSDDDTTTFGVRKERKGAPSPDPRYTRIPMHEEEKSADHDVDAPLHSSHSDDDYNPGGGSTSSSSEYDSDTASSDNDSDDDTTTFGVRKERKEAPSAHPRYTRIPRHKEEESDSSSRHSARSARPMASAAISDVDSDDALLTSHGERATARSRYPVRGERVSSEFPGENATYWGTASEEDEDQPLARTPSPRPGDSYPAPRTGAGFREDVDAPTSSESDLAEVGDEPTVRVIRSSPRPGGFGSSSK